MLWHQRFSWQRRAAILGVVGIAVGLAVGIGPAAALTIDDFEAGPFEILLDPYATDSLVQTGLPTGNVLAGGREIYASNSGNSFPARVFLEDTSGDDALKIELGLLSTMVVTDVIYRFSTPVDLRSDGSNAFEVVGERASIVVGDASGEASAYFIELSDGRQVYPFGLIEALSDPVDLGAVTGIGFRILDDSISELRTIQISPYTGLVGISARSGEDADLDGVFESLLPVDGTYSADLERRGPGERRIGVEFDLEGLPSYVVSAELRIVAGSIAYLPPIEIDVHGFVGDGVVQASDFEVDQLVAGDANFRQVDVTSFINARLAASDRYAGFSYRQMQSGGGFSLAGFLGVEAGFELIIQLAEEPDIDVAPATLDFGDVDIGESLALVATVTNQGSHGLTIGSVTYGAGTAPEFAITAAPADGTMLPPGGTADVVVEFTPVHAPAVMGAVEIASDDPDEPVVSVPLVGAGVTFEEQAQDLIDDVFDAGVAGGTLEGSGPGGSAEVRLTALRNLLEAAQNLIEAENIGAACNVLEAAAEKTDGASPPPDFVEGPDAATLYDEIQQLRSNLGC